MKIIIDYEASWRNSFLDGNNNEPLPKKGRGFVASMTSLKKEGNFISRDITLDTVMGLLNRLIGDQRKLYQSREKMGEETYFFEHIEKLVSFNDVKKSESNEIVFLRNMKNNNDQNAFSGMIKSNDPMFSSDYSQEFWSVLMMDFDELCQFVINNENHVSKTKENPLSIIARLECIDKEKPVENEGNGQLANDILVKHFPNDKFPENDQYLDKKGKIRKISLYCSALYLQMERLSHRFEMQSVQTKNGGIGGISKRGFTKRDFMKRLTSGNGKIIWGNPYILKQRVKGVGEVTSMLKKVNGQLEIDIDIDKAKARELDLMIKNAGVSSFYMGKKGLAFVSKIKL